MGGRPDNWTVVGVWVGALCVAVTFWKFRELILVSD